MQICIHIYTYILYIFVLICIKPSWNTLNIRISQQNQLSDHVSRWHAWIPYSTYYRLVEKCKQGGHSCEYKHIIHLSTDIYKKSFLRVYIYTHIQDPYIKKTKNAYQADRFNMIQIDLVHVPKPAILATERTLQMYPWSSACCPPKLVAVHCLQHLPPKHQFDCCLLQPWFIFKDFVGA